MTPKYNLKFQMAWHTQHPEYKAYERFIKMIKEETGFDGFLAEFAGRIIIVMVLSNFCLKNSGNSNKLIDTQKVKASALKRLNYRVRF